MIDNNESSAYIMVNKENPDDGGESNLALSSDSGSEVEEE